MAITYIKLVFKGVLLIKNSSWS